MAKMSAENRLARWQKKWDAADTEIRRQAQFAGERLGVFAAMRYQEREKRRIENKMEALREQVTMAAELNQPASQTQSVEKVLEQDVAK